MKFTEAITMSIKNIVASKVRTFLTMLGIIIGIVAVIVIVGLGDGLEGYIEDAFDSMGASNLTVMIMGRGMTSTSVSADDMYEIVDANPDLLEYMSPTISWSATTKIGSESFSTTGVTGVSEDYFEIQGYGISEGRGIVYGDIQERNKVCVIGEYLNDTYYSGAALGQTVKLNGYAFTIVGIMTQNESSMDEGGTDDAIYIPYTTASRLATSMSSTYTISLVDEDLIAESEAVIEEALLEIYSNDDSSYTIINLSSLIEEMQSMISMLVFILAGIAAISLLVGGVGIMNIMLVSVSERTREIGIRKSLGAKERYIMNQFIIEAAVTSALGGILGIILGSACCSIASAVIETYMGSGMTVSPSVDAMAIAFGISTGIGILFGYLPAKKAAVLNPIDALRYD